MIERRLISLIVLGYIVGLTILVRAELVGHWPFDEGSGTNTVDSSGSGMVGVLTGSPTPVWTSGISSNALGFDGSQNEVSVTNSGGLAFSNALTVVAWVKVATNVTGEIAAKWSTNSFAGSFVLSLTNGLPQFELILSSNYMAAVGAIGLTDTNWHQVAGAYDGAMLNVYLDLECSRSVSATGTIDSVAEPLRVGLLEARLDDVRIYNAALTTNDLATLFNADTDGDGVPNRIEAEAGTDPNDPGSFPSTNTVSSSQYEVTVSSITMTCANVNPRTNSNVWGTVVAGSNYIYSASGWCARGGNNPSGAAETDPDGKNHAGQIVNCIGGPNGQPSQMDCPSAICYSLVGKIGSTCFQMGTCGTFTAPSSGTLSLIFNDDIHGDNGGSFTVCIAPVTSASVTGAPVVFVNSDDDNSNGTNDVDDALNAIVNNENDLIGLDLNAGPAPPCATATLSLTAASGSRRHVRVWTNALRHATGPLLDNALGTSVSWPVSNTPNRVFLEGVSPSLVASDVVVILQASCCSVSATAKVTVVDVVSNVWEAISSPLTNNTLLGGPGGGLAIFPDRPNPTGVNSNYNQVRVEAGIQPAMPNIMVYFTSFDVDDPSATASPVDTESSPTDNRGVPETGMCPVFELTDGNGKAEVDFTVTMQPGDNFRVIASPLEDFAAGYHARQNTSSGEVVSVTDNAISNNYVTLMLTVWRRLWIERDTMQAVSNIDDAAAAGWVVKSSIAANEARLEDSVSGNYAGYEPDSDEFEGGVLDFLLYDKNDNLTSTLPQFCVAKNRELNFILPLGFSKVHFCPSLSTTQLAMLQAAHHVKYKMWDDDYGRLTASPQPQTERVDGGAIAANAYKDVYIVLTNADTAATGNNVTNRPFVRRFTLWNQWFTLGDTQNLPKDDPNCWCTLVLHGFEPHGTIGADFDPDGDPTCCAGIPVSSDFNFILGSSTNPWFNQSIVFCETSIESGYGEGMTMAHEMGHESVGDKFHLHGGDHLMSGNASNQDLNPRFLPLHQDEIRDHPTW